MIPSANPFAARNIRPGVVPFLFPAGESARNVVQRLQAQNYWGQIVGPHGSGKSTLLVAVLAELEKEGRQPLLVTLHHGEHRLTGRAFNLTPATQLVIDGYEQLTWWSRRLIKSRCRRARCGLLVTAHADVGLPTVFQTTPTVDLAQQVVRQLSGGDLSLITDTDIATAFAASGSNIRETLFALYDVHQEKQTKQH